MTRQSNKLSARTVATSKKQGRLSDGAGLYLKIDAGRRRWIFRYVRQGKAHELGLGPAATTTLAEARQRAQDVRSVLSRGIDPVAVKRAASDLATTFSQCAEEYIAAKHPEWRSAIHTRQWSATIESYCGPISNMPVADIDTAAVLKVLQPIWARIPETASRLRARIELILDSARARGLIDADRANPARWRGHLDHLLAKRSKLSRGHYDAMAYADVPAFMAGLPEDAPAALALRFLVLTATRLSETLDAEWTEIDTTNATWTIPAARTKSGLAHRVPLSGPALAVLERLAEVRTDNRVFMTSDKSMRKLLPAGATPHGFRASFSTWAAEATGFQREIVEAALSHSIGNATERAYRRTDNLEQRRVLMAAWAGYLTSHAHDNVVKFAG